jgi:hypothetical protein
MQAAATTAETPAMRIAPQSQPSPIQPQAQRPPQPVGNGNGGQKPKPVLSNPLFEAMPPKKG